MKLIKVKGIIIKEVAYKDNDKIVTILTDELGKISCMAKGAKKTNSPILASSQYLVYSEFILSKSKSFYYINSASLIDSFYDLRINFDLLEVAFEITKIVNYITDENQDTSKVLKLLLNTLFVIKKELKDPKFVIAIFKIKLYSLLGFSTNISKCNICKNDFDNIIYYDYVSNVFLCNKCKKEDNIKRYIKLSKPAMLAINYTISNDIKKVFSFDLKDNAKKEYITFGQVYFDTLTNDI